MVECTETRRSSLFANHGRKQCHLMSLGYRESVTMRATETIELCRYSMFGVQQQKPLFHTMTGNNRLCFQHLPHFHKMACLCSNAICIFVYSCSPSAFESPNFKPKINPETKSRSTHTSQPSQDGLRQEPFEDDEKRICFPPPSTSPTNSERIDDKQNDLEPPQPPLLRRRNSHEYAP